MQFNHSYYHSMDQGYYIPKGQERPSDLERTPNPVQADTNLGPQDIGFGSNPFQRPIQAISARIRQGVGYIDIPFFGAGKGNKERYTPETIGSKERRDIRELAKLNEVKLSTHASTNIQGLAGLGREGFDEKQREETLKEIKKAIDFSSDIQGGAVVFHTGEFMRPFSESKWNRDKMFVNYPEEEKIATIHMVDDRTGEMVGTVRKSVVVYEPDYEEDENGNWIDIDGNVIPKGTTDWERLLKRKPKWNQGKEQFETKKLEWQDFEKRANASGKTPEEEYMLSRMSEQLLRARGSVLYYAADYEGEVERREAIKEALEFYKKLDDTIPEEEKWKLTKQKGLSRYSDLVPSKEASPIELLESELLVTERRIKHAHEASSSFDVEAKNIQERLEHITPIADYGIRKSADTIARAGEYAWQMTRQKKTDRPIYISPESFMPSMWGSHPDEIQELVTNGRQALAERLKEKHAMSESQAQKLANEHIKGTLDVGHFNMWRQHFKAKQGENPEQTDKRFNKWYLDKVKGLVKGGYIGQVHITDNMGFDDEHLTPGEGNVPMKEVLKIVEDAGIKDIIVEAGSFNPVDVVADTFSYFGSPVYNLARGPSFQQFHQQSFGYNAPPFYVVGAYSPSNEWKLWSEVQME